MYSFRNIRLQRWMLGLFGAVVIAPPSDVVPVNVFTSVNLPALFSKRGQDPRGTWALRRISLIVVRTGGKVMANRKLLPTRETLASTLKSPSNRQHMSSSRKPGHT
ncbi:hypothetical protein BJ322DRAFT_246071 [Thelephora terrestris]|uniref:Secreted protein n=1 Tax=Thelephora terrestris TaxID=56493 RepID=A0A9P6HAQ2_9AGAM|nr:hypothetical protein BJ322DRAFT_246071 [Thelephora terrestris]